MSLQKIASGDEKTHSPLEAFFSFGEETFVPRLDTPPKFKVRNNESGASVDWPNLIDDAAHASHNENSALRMIIKRSNPLDARKLLRNFMVQLLQCIFNPPSRRGLLSFSLRRRRDDCAAGSRSSGRRARNRDDVAATLTLHGRTAHERRMRGGKGAGGGIAMRCECLAL